MFKIGNTPWNKGKKGIYIGDKASFYGKKHTEETKLKMSKSQKNHKVTKKTREKLRIANLGKKHSKETIEKQRKNMMGSNNPMYGISSPMTGKKHTLETLKKMRIAYQNSTLFEKNINTKPERFLKSILSVNGVKYESQKKIIGRPDIFIKPNICVFIDGCYYHACRIHNSEKSLNGLIPQKGIKRDKFVNKKLRNKGYKVLRFWEHEINNDLYECLSKIQGMINETQ